MSEEEYYQLGHGHGIDADMVDGLHAKEIEMKARRWSGGGPEAGLPCSYLVFNEGDIIKAINGSTGKTQFSGTDASTVINNALGALTAGRAQKEKVILKGTFTMTAKIRPSSYTILDLSQAILINSGITNSMIENYDTTNGNKFIDILGGEIDWNDGGTAPKVINFVKVEDSLIEGTYIHEVPSGSDSYAIQFDTVKRTDMRFGRFDDIASAGAIIVRASEDSNIIGWKTTNFGGGSGVSAIYLIFGYSGSVTKRCNIIDCFGTISTGTDGRGAQIYCYAEDCKIIGGVYKITATTSNTIQGINIGHTGYENTVVNSGAYDVTIIGKRADGSAGGTLGAVIQEKATVKGLKIRGANTGIYITNGNGSLVSDNTIDDYYSTGISVEEQVAAQQINNLRIANNILSNGGTRAIWILTGVENTVIEQNTFISAGTVLTDLGTNTMWGFGNIAEGKPYENSGTATITASTTTTFAHGLVGTPTRVDVGFKTAGYGSWIWSADQNNITITVATSGTYNLTWEAEYKP